jgi:hypothetical protein
MLSAIPRKFAGVASTTSVNDMKSVVEPSDSPALPVQLAAQKLARQ